METQKNKQGKQRNKPRIPKKINPTYLHNSGLYYLERFSASKAHFKSVMMRKVKRSCMHHKDQKLDECAQMVDELADKFERLDLLNDEVYARAVITSLRRRGVSKTMILGKMRGKGIGQELAIQELNKIDAENEGEDPEFKAALKLARKKRIGPYFIGDEEDIKKSLGKLARAGFSYDIARKVLEYELEEDIF